MNPSRATIPLIRPHQCDSDGGRIRGVLLYYHKITEYGIKCCMHAHLEAPRAPPSRGELYRCKTLFLDNFPFFFYPNGTWTHPPTSKLFLDFWNLFNFAKPLIKIREHVPTGSVPSVTERHVDKYITSIGKKKATGLDDLSAKVLKFIKKNLLMSSYTDDKQNV